MPESIEPHTRATDVQVAEDDYLHCIRCGLCLSVCPLYRLTLNETDSPRARVALLRAVREELVERPTGETAALFFRCMLCGACSYVCPSNIPLSQMFGMAKYQLGRLRRKEDAA